MSRSAYEDKQRGVRSLELELGSHELPGMGSGNQTWVSGRAGCTVKH